MGVCVWDTEFCLFGKDSNCGGGGGGGGGRDGQLVEFVLLILVLLVKIFVSETDVGESGPPPLTQLEPTPGSFFLLRTQYSSPPYWWS